MSRRPLEGKLLAAILFMILSALAFPDASQTHDDQAPAGPVMPRICTMIGCMPGVTLLSDLPLSFKAMRQARVRVCRNDTCLTGDFRGLGEAPTAGQGRGIMLPWDPGLRELPSGSPRVYVGVEATESGALSLRMGWVAWANRDLQAGDVYRLIIFNARGAKVFTLHETVTQYPERYLNGKECDSEPCRFVQIDRRKRTQP
ncbi:MAG TPA: hypothetical protein VI542_08195 [Candidatus Tectomicrobia bacterium]